MKILTILLVAIIIGSCKGLQTDQDKVQQAVKNYIKINANVASSYEPVGFGKVDTIYRIDTGKYEALDAIRKEIITKYNSAKSLESIKGTKVFKDQLLLINKQMDSSKIFVGLRIYHVFNGKNVENAVVVNRGSFYLDSNLLVNEFIMSEDSVLMLQNR